MLRDMIRLKGCLYLKTVKVKGFAIFGTNLTGNILPSPLARKNAFLTRLEGSAPFSSPIAPRRGAGPLDLLALGHRG